MSDRKELEKRAAELGLKLPAKVTDGKLAELIAEAEAKLDEGAKAANAAYVEELEAEVSKLSEKLLDRATALDDAEAKIKSLTSALEEATAPARRKTEAPENAVTCMVLSGIKHDGEDYVPGDRLSVSPAQHASLFAADAVGPITEL